MNDEDKPSFGVTARSLGEAYEDDTPRQVRMRAKLRENRQRRAAEEGLERE